MTRVVIIDDHPIVRNGIKMILQEEPELKVVGDGPDCDYLFDILKKQNVDILILDILLTGTSGFEVLPKIKNLYPDLKVLMLSALSEDIYATKSLKAGASGYIPKESVPEELNKAVKKVEQGGIYVSNAFAERLATNLTADSKQEMHEALSVREFQIFTLIGKGKSVGKIADELALSVKTISTYRSRILNKMNMKNNADIIKYCIYQNLV